jgi:steroid delta-isomerase-like uncharacterized protein
MPDASASGGPRRERHPARAIRTHRRGEWNTLAQVATATPGLAERASDGWVIGPPRRADELTHPRDPWHASRRRSPTTEDPVMPDATEQVTIEHLQAFADAFNRHDLDAILSFMTDDCVFEASAGPDVFGARHAGRDAVGAAFADVWATFPDAQWTGARHLVAGDRGVSEWTFRGTRADGTRVDVHGCDLFTFRDGKIALKDSYRKNRPPLSPPRP